jgi:hypothetical protein
VALLCPTISFGFSIEPTAKIHWPANVCRVARQYVKDDPVLLLAIRVPGDRRAGKHHPTENQRVTVVTGDYWLLALTSKPLIFEQSCRLRRGQKNR